MNTWTPTKLHSYSTSLSKVTVRFISQHFLWSQYTIPLKDLELYWLSWLKPFSKAFANILLSKIWLPHPRPFKKRQAAQFLTTFNKYSLQYLSNHKWYGIFSEDCVKIPKLPPGSQKDTFVTLLKLINTLFGIYNNKGLGNFKIIPNHTILKGMDAD